MEPGSELAARSCTVLNPSSRPRRLLAGVHMRKSDGGSFGGTCVPPSRASGQHRSPGLCPHWAPQARPSASTPSIIEAARC
eukprot:1424029-Pleurochrysis_carterae.AAC.1